MIWELIINVLFTQDALEGVALICRKCNVRKRVMVNDGKGCCTIGADCFSHVSMLTWHLFPDSNCFVLAHHAALSALRSYSSQRATR